MRTLEACASALLSIAYVLTSWSGSGGRIDGRTTLKGPPGVHQGYLTAGGTARRTVAPLHTYKIVRPSP